MDQQQADISQRLDNLTTFLRENMVTKQELTEQIDQLRLEVVTKEELRALTATIDGLAKIVKDFYQEVTIMSARVTRMETWIQQAANQIGVEYKP
jgi:hypothetical protein